MNAQIAHKKISDVVKLILTLSSKFRGIYRSLVWFRDNTLKKWETIGKQFWIDKNRIFSHLNLDYMSHHNNLTEK